MPTIFTKLQYWHYLKSLQWFKLLPNIHIENIFHDSLDFLDFIVFIDFINFIEFNRLHLYNALIFLKTFQAGLFLPMISGKSSMIFIWFLGTGTMVFQTTHNCSWIWFFLISGSASSSISAGSVQGKIFGHRASLLLGNGYNTRGLFFT